MTSPTSATARAIRGPDLEKAAARHQCPEEVAINDIPALSARQHQEDQQIAARHHASGLDPRCFWKRTWCCVTRASRTAVRAGALSEPGGGQRMTIDRPCTGGTVFRDHGRCAPSTP
jgi:hypothetical protein